MPYKEVVRDHLSTVIVSIKFIFIIKEKNAGELADIHVHNVEQTCT